ncbi:hypothetical protein EVJ58_g9126 [Rhodofomes roseus]|uniref:Uncharacterized protein n=1 Tax=Rhodofomes roseus TaxID=34475 RepID=A0A4Y9XZG2_9APHY|nr:hypothetical protein EVJ58_g9126 [Rhodofomes roseus]
MTLPTPVISIRIYYRPGGSKAVYMQSRANDMCQYYYRFLKQDLRFLGFPDPQETAFWSSLQGKVECGWYADPEDEDKHAIVETIREQVGFLHRPDAARMLELLEIAVIGLVPSRPSAVQPPVTKATEPTPQSTTPAQNTPLAVHRDNAVQVKVEPQEDSRAAVASYPPQGPIVAQTDVTERKLRELQELLRQHEACETKHKRENAGKYSQFSALYLVTDGYP